MTIGNRYRNTYAEIDLEAIEYNVIKLKSLLPQNSKMMGVVKADGYGHGSVPVAKRMLDKGVDFLMVALLEEAVTLRENGITVPILVVGRVAPKFASVAAEMDITVAVFQLEWLQEVEQRGLTKPISTHLELETGMGRTGVVTEETLTEILSQYKRSDNVRLDGVFTHFATADEVDSPYYFQQKNRFEEMLNHITKYYDEPLTVHIGNSAAGIQFPEQMKHYTRFGIASYGLYPSNDIRELQNVNLKEAFSLYSELVQVKKLQPGESVSYGATYTAIETEWIGTMPIGYGDGWSRSLQGFYVLINGKKMPIVGRICMDAMMVKLDGPYEVGTKVTLIGRDGGAVISSDDVAQYLNTINYEIPCMMTSRLIREYKC